MLATVLCSIRLKRIERIFLVSTFIQYSRGSLQTTLVTMLLHCHSANIYHLKLVLMQHYPINISSTKQLYKYIRINGSFVNDLYILCMLIHLIHNFELLAKIGFERFLHSKQLTHLREAIIDFGSHQQ